MDYISATNTTNVNHSDGCRLVLIICIYSTLVSTLFIRLFRELFPPAWSSDSPAEPGLCSLAAAPH